MPDGPIRVVFLEDERGIAEVTKEALASRGIEVIGLAATVEDAVGLAAHDRPDVIVADIDLAGELALGLPAAVPPEGPPVLWWSGHDQRYRQEAVRAGGAGYVSKTGAGLESLVSAIRRVAAGEETWTQDDRRAERTAPRPPSSREREVLAGVAEGHPNKEIAADLGISERTVESHVRRMFDRYTVSNRVELLSMARRSGWL
jgi:Response regulator containing a CheY-like receiver domain and an HTH DNA-binding domain